MKNVIVAVALLVGYAQARDKCNDGNAAKLVKAYAQLSKCKNNTIIWRDGTKMRYDDGKKKSAASTLKNTDIEDMFRDSYKRGPYANPKKSYDPGRYRNDKFFRKMYGNSSGAVKRKLKTIRWMPNSGGGKLRVTSVNGVDKALARVSRDLDKLCAKNPKYKKFVTKTAGTFKWRKIAGTSRLSVHSYGAAIDINVKHSAYWRWNKGAYRYQNKIPKAIVKIFEKHGFIWGGKWYHYDTMHFEYRPELLR